MEVEWVVLSVDVSDRLVKETDEADKTVPVSIFLFFHQLKIIIA